MPKNLHLKIKQILDRPPRYHNRIFEKRATIKGITIYGSAASDEDCFLAFLENLTQKLPLLRKGTAPVAVADRKKPPKSILFSAFAYSWFEEIHRKKVLAETCEKDRKTFKRHVEPYFANRTIQSITASDCIQFKLQFEEKNIGRTLENCEGLLRQVLQYAVDCEIIQRHPMSTVKSYKHERENGVPLSIEEERAFLSAIKGTKYEPVFILSLYTGLRPCELSTARIEGGFIVARNRKQKNVKKIVYKKIPITPMLQPHLDLLRTAMEKWDNLTKSEHYLSEIFSNFCEGHTLKDLRTTFSTKCQECEVPENVVQLWMGHSSKTVLGRVYTKLSDDYLLKEGRKVKY